MARNARRQRETQVEFVREFPNATQVCLAGTFNEWHPRATEMINMGGSRWAKALMLPPGRYEYRFVVDGRWEDDPMAVETAPNAFGTRNAVLNVCAGKNLNNSYETPGQNRRRSRERTAIAQLVTAS